MPKHCFRCLRKEQTNRTSRSSQFQWYWLWRKVCWHRKNQVVNKLLESRGRLWHNSNITNLGEQEIDPLARAKSTEEISVKCTLPTQPAQVLMHRICLEVTTKKVNSCRKHLIRSILTSYGHMLYLKSPKDSEKHTLKFCPCKKMSGKKVQKEYLHQ